MAYPCRRAYLRIIQPHHTAPSTDGSCTYTSESSVVISLDFIFDISNYTRHHKQVVVSTSGICGITQLQCHEPSTQRPVPASTGVWQCLTISLHKLLINFFCKGIYYTYVCILDCIGKINNQFRKIILKNKYKMIYVLFVQAASMANEVKTRYFWRK